MTIQRRIPPSEANAEQENTFRALPSVSQLLEALETGDLAREFIVRVIRFELDLARAEISRGQELRAAEVVTRCQEALDRIRGTRLDALINGTGIILHTNLGRAPVSQETADAMSTAAASYVSLEIDPESNQRGGRMEEISRLMRLLTGAEATLVVNNNAAAVLLTLAGLCAGREVVVSRGEAVEIGGGFRIPDVIAQSGCRLVDVGTTNRTYARDYARAIGPETGALLKVHASNFRIEGFATIASTGELSPIAAARGIPLIEDLGSGCLLDTTRYGIRGESTVGDAIGAGASIVTLSGDKLLGGPQAGLIAGKAELIREIESHPLARAARADKVTLAGVARTLRHYLAGEAELAIPIWRSIGTPPAELDRRARIIADTLGLATEATDSSIGGGSLPGETLPSWAVSITTSNADGVARKLRTGVPHVFPLVREGRVLVDLRAVDPRQDADLIEALRRALG